MMSYQEELLPHDVIMEILSWLPPDKLLKFRSVRKSWYSTIRDAKFIAKHQSHFGNMKNNGRIVIVTKKDSRALIFPKLGLVHDSNPGMVYDITESKFDFSECCNIVGSCNGMFCSASYHVDDGPIQLCNPSIRWTTRVPPFRFNNKITYPDVFRYCYGVGFDRFTTDYKVVKFIGPEFDISKRGKAGVYSVKAKSWKIVNALVPPYLFCGYLSSFFLHGFIHWLAYLNGKYKIILFDVCNDVFEVMQLPEVDIDTGISIYVVKDSLCRLEMKCHNKICHMWMMKEYGVTESWTKQQTIVLKNGISRFINLTVGGKFLCSARKSNGLEQLILYDPETDEYINVGQAPAPSREQDQGMLSPACENLCPLVATLELLDVVS